MKKISVVILNWNGRDLLEEFLPSVVKFTNSNTADIVIADNNSTDQSVLFVKQQYPSLSIIKLPDNYGYAEGYNKALQQIESEYYVLLNSDVEVSENWLDPIIDHLDKNKDIAAAQPKILSQKNKTLFEYAGACGGFIDRLGYPFCRGRIFNNVEQDHNQYNKPIDIFWASGACLVIRAKDYWNAGGLDATFFAHMEEIDLCWRLNARGKKIVCLPHSIVYHVGGATLQEESPRKTFLNFRNNLLMLYKNTSDGHFNRIFRYRKILDYIAALQMLISGKKKNAKAVLDAHKDFKSIRNEYIQIRDKNLLLSTTTNIKSIYPQSILADFYLKRKKLFSDLKW
ncbi:glycosyltransferase family 2 protein [Dysgonomonas macrotermitis]|uniref:Glycosyltransferase 2-like domain-containing protein n=1 Tax=Dysgonomonas macrotermitis TaxID=1346286 RepID=A0A1M5DSF5_9BACT|nr:glycosyltransferase family 2 protein [Dysgonomonas macrotermitis]SHF69781.1 hypothetical protein SAMN05444362_10938 [Dysgonomonas macrotermitis]